MIDLGVSKRYGEIAVDDLTIQVRPGIVTGFLGPNGAGKSTTMRLILGLDAPTSGAVSVRARPDAGNPARTRVQGVTGLVGLGEVARKHVDSFFCPRGATLDAWSLLDVLDSENPR